MFKFKNPADFYNYILKEILTEEFLSLSPYKPKLDLIYGENFSIYKSRKVIYNYYREFRLPYYSEDKWEFFPIIYQFQALDITKKENEEFYSSNVENDTQLEVEYLKSVIHKLIDYDFREALNHAKDEILNHYLEENQRKLKETLKTIESSIESNLKVLEFFKKSLESYKSNSHLNDIIILQQHHLLDVFFELIQEYVKFLHSYMQVYCEEEVNLFEEILLKHTTNQYYTVNA